MKRSLGLSGSITLAMFVACGGGGSDNGGGGPKNDASGFAADDPSATNTNAISSSLATAISIAQVSAYQMLEVGLEKDGMPVDRTTGIQVPLVAKRDAVFRVFVNPDASFKPQNVTARIKIQLTGPTSTETRVFYATKMVSAASTQADFSSTINVNVPGDALENGATYGVVLNAAGGGAAPATSTARYPQDGSLDDLGVSGGGDVIHIMVVPCRYKADGSGRLPDTSDGQLKIIADRFYQLYPGATIDVQAHDPVDFTSPVDPGGGGFDAALMLMGKVRSADHAPSDVYYYASFEPADNFGAFCGGGCVTGLSTLGSPISSGIGYSGPDTAETMVHEIGHAHGLDHAPFCGASAQPNYWPTDPAHDMAHLGVWGFDQLAKDPTAPLMDPTKYSDLMSYCGNNWVSDFHAQKLFKRVKADNNFYADYHRGAFWRLQLRTSGALEWASDTTQGQAWMTYGQPKTIDVTRADGTHAIENAVFFPYDHLPGGELYVATDGAMASAASVRVFGKEIAAPALVSAK